VRPLAEYLQTRNALILSLLHHDQWLQHHKKQPGQDREAIVNTLLDMGVQPWQWGEDPWAR
jgi:hypothetical protein